MISTDTPFRAESTYPTSVKNPLSKHCNLNFDLVSSARNKYSSTYANVDGLNFFGKLTDCFPTDTYRTPIALKDNLQPISNTYQSLANGLATNLEQGSSQRNERYQPYATVLKDRRLGKILYRSTSTSKPDELLSPIPRKYAGYSIQDKLTRLKNMISNLDVTPKPKSEQTTHGSVPLRSLLELSTIGPGRFHPSKTSTPIPATQAVDKYSYSPLQQQPTIEISCDFNECSEIIQTTQAKSQPITAKKFDVSETAQSSSLYGSVALCRPISIEKKWRERKYNDEWETCQRQAEELKKELHLREKARTNRALDEEENRRLRLKLEGLVLERRVPPREEFPVLSSSVKQFIKIVWDRRQKHDEVFVSGFGADITRKDLLTLSGLEWLNDEVINFFLNLVVERNQQEPGLPKVYTFNTFFYQKLSTMGYAGVKRWTKKVDIFSNEILIVPVHLPQHWCLAIIDFKEEKIDYYDSLGGKNELCIGLLREYLGQESLDKRKQPFDTDNWKCICRENIPRQKNFSDCGMFSCLFAEYASRRAPVTFNQNHIPYFRERMVYEICQKKLL